MILTMPWYKTAAQKKDLRAKAHQCLAQAFPDHLPLPPPAGARISKARHDVRTKFVKVSQIALHNS